jgi:hypothetical protein
MPDLTNGKGCASLLPLEKHVVFVRVLSIRAGLGSNYSEVSKVENLPGSVILAVS